MVSPKPSASGETVHNLRRLNVQNGSRKVYGQKKERVVKTTRFWTCLKKIRCRKSHPT